MEPIAGVRHLPRLLVIAWPVAIVACAAEVAVLLAASAFLWRPTRAPLAALTLLLIAGALVCIPLIVVVVWSAVAPGAADRVPSRRGRWSVLLAVGLFAFAVAGTWLALPSEHPVMIDGVGGVLHAPLHFEVLPADQYNALVLQQLRFVSIQFVTATGWILLALAAQRRRRAGVSPTSLATAAPTIAASALAPTGLAAPHRPPPSSSDPADRRRRSWFTPSVLTPSVLTPPGLATSRMGARHS